MKTKEAYRIAIKFGEWLEGLNREHPFCFSTIRGHDNKYIHKTYGNSYTLEEVCQIFTPYNLIIGIEFLKDGGNKKTCLINHINNNGTHEFINIPNRIIEQLNKSQK